jgi:periplasmic protein TonB
MTDSPFANPEQDLTPSPRPRRPYRPPIGIPSRGEGRGWRSVLVSVAVHGAILLALLLPAFLTGVFDADTRSAGAEGPRGGGGGGRGLSGMPERLQFVRIAPAPAPQPQQVTVPQPPPPKVEPPPVVPPPSPTPPAAEPTAPSAGGSASGSDGTDGTGKGVGGGAGAGQGTGQGTAAGAGTGGDGNEHDPPVVTNLAILPIPVPRNVRPYRMVAYFDVDERGTAKLLSFNPSNDGGYNRRIRDMLSEIRFRPAVRRDGTAVRDTAMIVAEAP